uniref:AlNc14C4G630 protein n=1 Tax=Albugo laibachii Nc14 TaxID=890382 RepID=F0W0I8_9STRA|nr:AlNc14C4G630 [Albugo laibachii Nc14]|eukprot:CCA14560.1 AlNc14C4G630 [Albugo laibachii Nc14]
MYNSEHWEVIERLKHTFELGTYYTGWKLKWKSLNEMIRSKQLYASSKATTIDPQAYISKNRGMYAFSLNKENYYAFYFGIKERSESHHSSMRFVPENKLPNAKLEFWPDFYPIKFNFSTEVTKVPRNYYKNFRRATGFHLSNDFYQTECSSEIPQIPFQKELHAVLKLEGNQFFAVDPSTYIVRNGQMCIFLLSH